MMKRKRYLTILLAVMAACCLLLASAAAETGGETAEPAVSEAPAATAAPGGNAQGVLAAGSSGPEVVRLQERLRELRYLNGEADGKFGGGTRRALIAFQRRNGLETDGAAGPATLAKLYSADAIPAPEDQGPADVLSGELPVLVNKEHPVDEYFQPADLVQLSGIVGDLARIKYKKTRGVRTAAEALAEMLKAARADGLKKWQISAGYRTWDDQVSLLNAKISSYLKSHKDWGRAKAKRAALRTVAEAGCSEHHLGLAFDVNVPGASTFSSTKQCKWMHEHCWEYGFIVRYPEGKEEVTGFAAESWHIRYVGTRHSLYMQELGLCLEEYLAGIEAGEIAIPPETVTEDVILE